MENFDTYQNRAKTTDLLQMVFLEGIVDKYFVANGLSGGNNLKLIWRENAFWRKSSAIGLAKNAFRSGGRQRSMEDIRKRTDSG